MTFISFERRVPDVLEINEPGLTIEVGVGFEVTDFYGRALEPVSVLSGRVGMFSLVPYEPAEGTIPMGGECVWYCTNGWSVVLQPQDTWGLLLLRYGEREVIRLFLPYGRAAMTPVREVDRPPVLARYERDEVV